MLGVVDADVRRGIDFVRRDGNPDAVRELHHALLLQIREPHVALEQVVLQHLRALQLHLEMGDAGDRDPHLVINALPLHQIAGAVDARPGAHARFVRLALLHRLVRGVARTAHGRDAECEPRAPCRFAKIGLQVRVEFDESRHHGEVRRVDEVAARMVRVRVRHDAHDFVAVDQHVDVRARLRALHVHERAGVHDDVAGRNRGRVLQIERNRARLAGLDVDDAELVERLIQDVARIALPARRVRALRGDAARRAERLAGDGDRPYRQDAFVNRGHLRAVGRPRGAAAAARIDREHRLGREPLIVL